MYSSRSCPKGDIKLQSEQLTVVVVLFICFLQIFLPQREHVLLVFTFVFLAQCC
jgi:hypothetical protein